MQANESLVFDDELSSSKKVIHYEQAPSSQASNIVDPVSTISAG